MNKILTMINQLYINDIESEYYSDSETEQLLESGLDFHNYNDEKIMDKITNGESLTGILLPNEVIIATFSINLEKEYVLENIRLCYHDDRFIQYIATFETNCMVLTICTNEKILPAIPYISDIYTKHRKNSTIFKYLIVSNEITLSSSELFNMIS